MPMPSETQIIAALEKQYGLSLAGYRIAATAREITTVFDPQDVGNAAERLVLDDGDDVADAVVAAFKEYARDLEIPDGFIGITLVKSGQYHNPQRPRLSGLFLTLN